MFQIIPTVGKTFIKAKFVSWHVRDACSWNMASMFDYLFYLKTQTGCWAPRKAPCHRLGWMSDALGLSDQNTAGQGCRRPMWFLKGRHRHKETRKWNDLTTHLYSHLFCYKAFVTDCLYWPALGYVATSISSGRAWKFWTFSQLSVK